MSIENNRPPWKRFLTIQTVSSLALLVVAIVAVRWIVATQRAPGSMTITEAQGMDMTTSKPPPGVQPVAAEPAVRRSLAGKTWYPATLQSYADEEVVARIPGRLVRLTVYPGDRVTPGQLLGVLDAPEYVAQAGEAAMMARSMLAMATAAEREQQAASAMYRRALSEQSAAQSSIARANNESAAMTAERDQMLAEAKMADSELDEARAAAKYQEANLLRQRKLQVSGAISLDELQVAQKERDMAVAKVAAAQAKGESARRRADVAERKRSAARSEVLTAQAMYKAAQADAEVAKAGQLKAKAEAEARKREYQAGASGASGFEAMAGFRNLRALSNGVVSERLVAPGTSVMAGQVVLRLKVMDRMRVQADLPQSNATSVSLGQQVDVKVGDRLSHAIVSAIFPAVNEATRTFRIEAILENGSGLFKAGSFATVALVAPSATTTLVVRTSAVQADLEGGAFVWVLQETAGSGQPTDWTCTMHPEISKPGAGTCPICKMDLVPRSRMGNVVAVMQTVQLGKSDGKYTEVVQGLRERQQVIWAGFEGLQPNTPVKSVEWGANGARDLPNPEGGMPDMDDSKAPPSNHAQDAGTKGGAESGDSTEVWTCPMHPEILRPGPGECPICHMDLERKADKK